MRPQIFKLVVVIGGRKILDRRLANENITALGDEIVRIMHADRTPVLGDADIAIKKVVRVEDHALLVDFCPPHAQRHAMPKVRVHLLRAFFCVAGDDERHARRVDVLAESCIHLIDGHSPHPILELF